MKLLSKGDGRVVKIVQKNKLSPNAAYRLSQFVYAKETPDGAVLKNTLTKQVYALEVGEWESARAGDISHPAVQELARKRFLTEANYDELSQYNLVLSVLRTMEKKDTGVAAYTILPTTGCNARCVYCYENGWKVLTMTPETADAVADFVCRSKHEGKIRLDWFGGEPLLGAATISRICRTLQARGVEYESGVITNATLLTPELAKETVELWNLKRAQVSMDGARADYEARKKYVQPEIHNYDVAMDAVALLANSGVDVTLRCNYDGESLPRLKEFFDECATRFADLKNVSIYLAQLFQSASLEKNETLYQEAAQAEQALQELELATAPRSDRWLRIGYCMADSGGSHVIVDPEGGLHLCEHVTNGAPFGSVFDETVRFPVPTVKLAEECKACNFLPECTAFRKNGCPVTTTFCHTQIALQTDRALLELLKRTEDEENEEPEGAEAVGECP